MSKKIRKYGQDGGLAKGEPRAVGVWGLPFIILDDVRS